MAVMARGSVLVVESDEGLARSLQILIEDEASCDVCVVHSAREAVTELLRGTSTDLVVSDAATALASLSEPGASQSGAGDMQDATLLEMIQRRFPNTVVILMTAHQALFASLEHGSLVGGGILRKPIDPSALLASVEAATRAAPHGARPVS